MSTDVMPGTPSIIACCATPLPVPVHGGATLYPREVHLRNDHCQALQLDVVSAWTSVTGSYPGFESLCAYSGNSCHGTYPLRYFSRRATRYRRYSYEGAVLEDLSGSRTINVNGTVTTTGDYTETTSLQTTDVFTETQWDSHDSFGDGRVAARLETTLSIPFSREEVEFAGTYLSQGAWGGGPDGFVAGGSHLWRIRNADRRLDNYRGTTRQATRLAVRARGTPCAESLGIGGLTLSFAASVEGFIYPYDAPEQSTGTYVQTFSMTIPTNPGAVAYSQILELSPDEGFGQQVAAINLVSASGA